MNLNSVKPSLQELVNSPIGTTLIGASIGAGTVMAMAGAADQFTPSTVSDVLAGINIVSAASAGFSEGLYRSTMKAGKESYNQDIADLSSCVTFISALTYVSAAIGFAKWIALV